MIKDLQLSQTFSMFKANLQSKQSLQFQDFAKDRSENSRHVLLLMIVIKMFANKSKATLLQFVLNGL